MYVVMMYPYAFSCVCISYHFPQAVRCGEVLGYYVSVEVWSSLVVPAVKTSAGCHMVNAQQRSTVPVGPVQCTSCLMVLAACMRGAKKDCIQPYLKVHNSQHC